MDKTKSRFTTIEAILMAAKAFAPLISIIFVEQMKGPGYSASAKETFWYATILLLVLGVASFWNLQKAMNYAAGKTS